MKKNIFEEMNQKELQTENGRIVYWVSSCCANKRTLVLLHGLTADHTLFDRQIRYFIGRYNILCWDNPAHGSSRPYSDFSYSRAADQLRDILEREQITEAVFIGPSMGGYITQTFMKKYPQMVTGFVGIDTCPFGEQYYSKSDKWWLHQVEWMSRCYPHKLLIKEMAKACSCTIEGQNNMRRSLSVYTKKELCHLMGIGFAGFLEENCNLRITCPVLILVGEHDHTGKVMQYCRQWNKETAFPFYVIPDAAHNSNYDNSDEVNARIEAFLANLEHGREGRVKQDDSI